MESKIQQATERSQWILGQLAQSLEGMREVRNKLDKETDTEAKSLEEKRERLETYKVVILMALSRKVDHHKRHEIFPNILSNSRK